MNLSSKRTIEQNNKFKLKVFNFDEKFGQVLCKNNHKVFN